MPTGNGISAPLGGGSGSLRSSRRSILNTFHSLRERENGSQLNTIVDSFLHAFDEARYMGKVSSANRPWFSRWCWPQIPFVRNIVPALSCTSRDWI